MRFQILSHAAIDIHCGARLVIDPWLHGSCYWDSWWHFPEPAALDRPLAPGDFVYVTHGHEDHLHEDTLSGFDRGITVLLPRLPATYLREAVEALGFRDVVEIPHGTSLRLGPHLVVTSYQSGWVDDSALIVEGGGVAIGDLNDALFPPAVLKAIAARHGPLDFLLKSHSSASAYPHGFDSPDPADLALYDERDFIGNFFHYARALRARHAVPFASNVCFLHPESRPYNRHAIDPLRVLAARADQPAGTPEVVLMLPGDRWSVEAGFQAAAPVAERLAAREAEIERLARAAAPRLAARARREAARAPSFERFAVHFGALCRHAPWPVRWLRPIRIGFEIRRDAPEWWVVDLGRGRVERCREAPAALTATVHVAPGLLDDALERGLFGFVDISKRMRVSLSSGEILRYAVFRELVGLHEAGYLPLWRSLLRPRFLGAWLRRWRELASYARAALRGPRALVPRPPRDGTA